MTTEGIDDSGDYDDDADDMEDESLDEYGDQNDGSGKKKTVKEAISDKNSSGDSTPKQVLP